MRRAFFRSVGPIRSVYRHHRDEMSAGVAKRLSASNISNGTLDKSSFSYDTCKCGGPSYVFSRSMSSDAAEVDYTETKKKAGPLVEYKRRIAAGDLEDGDTCQMGTLREIQRLYDELVESADACHLDRYSDSGKSGRRRWLWSRFIPQSTVSPVKGLYLYGGVGTGKTMLMDLFYDQLHRGVSDPLEVVAGEIFDESVLLCLDEFIVNDVADATILNRLFGHLFSNGAILVATSNRAPDNLYERGLQRDLFLPFIATLKERCVIHEIGSSIDYRRRTSAEEGFYFVNNDSSDFLMQKFKELVGEHKAQPQVVEVVMGRKLQVPLGGNGCAYFQFEDLCDKPLGAADYFGLCKNYHTLALDDVPIFGLHNRTAAYRFVTLVDVMYENKTRLMCTAEGTPFELFERIVTISDAQSRAPRTSSRSRKNDDYDICVDNELGFAKDRTISSYDVVITELKRGGPLVEYERRIKAGELEDGDNCQIATLREIQRLYDELVESADACRLDRYSDSRKSGRSRWLWSRLMPQSLVSPVKGIYLYGGVGTGKTMLMDLFYDQLPCNWRKKRIHFHDFMLNVHIGLHRHKGVSDPLDFVARELSDESILLCLDEFMVNDVSVALILNRLFAQLFSNGVRSFSTLYFDTKGPVTFLFALIFHFHTISDAQSRAPRTSSRSRKNDDYDICVDNELGFAKDRTISRLTEMNSKEYLEQHAEMIAEKQLPHMKMSQNCKIFYYNLIKVNCRIDYRKSTGPCHEYIPTNCQKVYKVSLEAYLRWTVQISKPTSRSWIKDDKIITELKRGGPLVEYERRIKAGELEDGDNCQIATLREIQRLYDELVESADACRLDRYSDSRKSGSRISGVGGYGHDSCPSLWSHRPCNWRKKRVHFHDFMLNVHIGLHRHKGVSDPLDFVARELSDESILLCLDEFMVNDVSVALILNRLFAQLFSNGVAEEGFYFLKKDSPDLLMQKFIDLVGEHTARFHEVEVVMGRKLQNRKISKSRIGTGTIGSGSSSVLHGSGPVLGPVPVLWFFCSSLIHNMAKLFSLYYMECDYVYHLEVTLFYLLYAMGRYHWVQTDVHIFGLRIYVTNLLVLQTTLDYASNELTFSLLIQVMYENKARLMCTAEGTPLELFERIVSISDAQSKAPRTSSRSRKSDDHDLCVDNQLAFAKDRTISRLTEMNSRKYLEQHTEMTAYIDLLETTLVQQKH
ncbi:AFG1-like ATPase family protein [Artemisia annua]|uniref:AFG1-like ATPase family protein n=1 Tax=Artemisia annua TaxID=35608 RepID=A0A2U1QAI6_ARTAN|nr:AFG1-like ATPase family protein [Artemisia annua]